MRAFEKDLKSYTKAKVTNVKEDILRRGQKLKRTVAADKTITRRPALLLASLQGRELVKSRRVVITGLLSG